MQAKGTQALRAGQKGDCDFSALACREISARLPRLRGYPAHGPPCPEGLPIHPFWLAEFPRLPCSPCLAQSARLSFASRTRKRLNLPSDSSRHTSQLCGFCGFDVSDILRSIKLRAHFT